VGAVIDGAAGLPPHEPVTRIAAAISNRRIRQF
jgi:hypothetical protein